MTTAGVNHDVNHPGLVMVGTNAIVLGTPDPQHPDFFTGLPVVSLSHVVRVEVLTPAAPA